MSPGLLAGALLFLAHLVRLGPSGYLYPLGGPVAVPTVVVTAFPGQFVERSISCDPTVTAPICAVVAGPPFPLLVLVVSTWAGFATLLQVRPHWLSTR